MDFEKITVDIVLGPDRMSSGNEIESVQLEKFSGLWLDPGMSVPLVEAPSIIVRGQQEEGEDT